MVICHFTLIYLLGHSCAPSLSPLCSVELHLCACVLMAWINEAEAHCNIGGGLNFLEKNCRVWYLQPNDLQDPPESPSVYGLGNSIWKDHQHKFKRTETEGGKEREAERKEVNDRALWLRFRGWMTMRVWRNGGEKGEKGVDNLRERAGQPTVRYGDGAEQRRRCWGGAQT